MKSLNFIYSFVLSFIFFSASSQEVNIEIQKLSDHVYMLIGQGGNIGVSAGDDGVFVIDDQFAPLTPKIIAALKTISDQAIKYVVNTHHHGDHTGGNENLGKLGATIIAHDNVRKHLENKPKEALPVITFNDKMSVYINGEQVHVFHLDNAHTDGDSMLYFTKSNVLHTGDIYFKERYPYIDLNSGGTVNGYIEAIKQVLIIIDDDTKIIPGHGSVSNKKEYQDFLKMLETLKTKVEAEIEAGKTEDEVAKNENITKAYDDLGFGSGYVNSERIKRTFYSSLKN